MLQKPATSRRALISYAAILIPTTLLWMCTQTDDVKLPKEQIVEVDQPANQVGIDGEVFTVVENQPDFPGGMVKLSEFISQNIRYPEAARRANVQGRVFVSFVVNKQGAISDVQILKGLGFGTDEEAIRVVKQMPHWKPGSQDGHLVNVRFNLPVKFELKEGELGQGHLDNKDRQGLRAYFTTYFINGKKVSFDEFEELAEKGKHGVEGKYYKNKTATMNLYTTNKQP